MYEGMLAETIRFPGNNGDEIEGYFARPLGAGPYPGVVVIQEIFGLVEHIKEVTRKIAAHGYAALAPDLYSREGFADPDDRAAALRAAGGLPDDRAVGDIRGAARYLRSLPYGNGKVGIIGFCSGGRHTYLAACNIPFDAAVDCYGGRVVVSPEELTPNQPKAVIDMTADLTCPLLGLFGAEDANPSPEHVARIEEELKRHGKVYEFHTYQDAGHAFFADYRPSYRQHAAVDGWQRIFSWFDRYLSTAGGG